MKMNKDADATLRDLLLDLRSVVAVQLITKKPPTSKRPRQAAMKHANIDPVR